MTLQPIRALVDSALGGLHIAVCEPCGGWGTIGLSSLPATCPSCCGAGRIITTELEMSHDTRSAL